ncbi:MAG: non-homologous end joining protein Ku [Desulfitobacteriaceae bacterium]
MHTLWKGSLSFGLVNVPVKMHAATESRDFQFHYLHDQCHQRVRYVKKCPHCNVDVGNKDLVKGYEFEKDRYVIISDEDLESFEQPMSRSIDILDFINLVEVDPIYYQKSYYLSPEDTAIKAYRLLCQAMAESGKVAVARFTIRSKQHLACLRVNEQVLVLETMYYPSEIRRLDASMWQRIEPTIAELNMARQLIDNLARPFDPGQYRDESRERMTALIESKVAGETIKIEAVPREGKVLDLMEALRASIAITEKQKGKPAEQQAGEQDLANPEVQEVNPVVKPDVKNESTLKPRKRRTARAKGA